MDDIKKDAGVRFEPELYIYFIYNKEADTVEVWRNGELISSGSSGGVTPEQLYEILHGYVSKPELAETLLDYLTDEDLEDYVTSDQLILTLADYVNNDKQATDEELGLVKVNSEANITLNEDGQLEVGGRLGQFSSEETPNGGVYYPDTITPEKVGPSSFLMTDGAKSLSVQGRTFAIMAGTNLTCKNAAAGTTEYHLSNNQANRFYCFAGQNGRLAIDQADATENGTAAILDISYANGDPITPYFGPTESTNDIIITVDRTVNPDAATKKLRIYGYSNSTDVIVVGQGCGARGGKVISLGQACYAGGNQCIAFGNSSIVLANNSVALGHTNYVDKAFCFAAGQGHDFTNASDGTGAVGICSELGPETVFAAGNGTFASNGNNVRSNAFEVLKDGSIVLKSPNNTRYKIAVDDSGNLTTTAIVTEIEEG